MSAPHARHLARVRTLATILIARLEPWIRRRHRELGALAGWLGHLCTRHRGVVASILTRTGWWGSLLLVLWGAQRLFDAPAGFGSADPERAALGAFAGGFAAATLGVVFAPQRYMRRFSFGLATAHGGLALLAWWALHP